MMNGNILLCASPAPQSSSDYPSPTAFFEYDYLTNSFLQVTAPGFTGLDTLSHPCYYTNMLDLPDGSVLYCDQGDNQYHIYTPSGTQLTAGMPTIGTVLQINCDTFRVTGTLFNGISEGAAYGDDWQMATNYPVIRLENGPFVYYARSFDWNRTGVQIGNLADTAYFSLPSGLQPGTYSLFVTASGIHSAPTSFVYSNCSMGMANNTENISNFSVYPNPAESFVTLSFKTRFEEKYNLKVFDVFGRIIKEETGKTSPGDNAHTVDLSEIAKGVYTLAFQKRQTNYNSKIILK